MKKWAVLAEVAVRQHLAFAVWQARWLGITEHALHLRVVHQGWERSHAGVLSLPGPRGELHALASALLAYSHPTTGAARAESARLRGASEVDALVAAAFKAGPRVCGESALWLYGVAAAPRLPWVRLPASYGHAARADVRLRYGDARGDTLWRNGLPCVDPAQAFIDVAKRRSGESAAALHHRLTKWLSTADARRVLTALSLRGRITPPISFYGAPALRRAVEDVLGELSHSATERRARQLTAPILAGFGLQLERRPHPVELGGRRIAEADLAVVALQYDLEVDGPHHLLPAQREKDQERDRLLRRAGWEVDRYSTELIDLWPVTFTARVADTVRYLVQRRRFDPDIARGGKTPG